MGFLSDIAELAKAGYSVSDVKELLAMNKEPKEQPKETEEAKEKEVDSKEKEVDSKEKEVDSKEKVPETETKEAHKEEPEVDYKAEYEKLLKEKNAADLHKDLSGIDKALSNEEQIEKMFKEIL